ncbi:MAG TPA: FdtA/QdtA family cupin domain-containing protein [Candidatus Thermoplasmatota archaeon]|nr:FdtA/QdtA family cupin domain-containing protein [Candidatus Thermoplasmatota archaeon]
MTLPTRTDARGALTILDPDLHLPFPIRLAYWITDVPPGAERGHHAHRRMSEFLVPLTGGLTVSLHDGVKRSEHVLRAPSTGLRVPAGTWLELRGFQPGTALLVLASSAYREEETLRDFAEFVQWKEGRVPS